MMCPMALNPTQYIIPHVRLLLQLLDFTLAPMKTCGLIRPDGHEPRARRPIGLAHSLDMRRQHHRLPLHIPLDLLNQSNFPP
jgi:hypothetical protein